MITYSAATTDEELYQILALQRKNTFQEISSEERKTEGFVTVQHDFNLLKRMNHACPHSLAKENNTVVGYALCMHPKFRDSIPILKSMFAEIDRVTASDTIKKYIVMGQICIDKEYRGKGIFRKLYENMQQIINPEFSKIITEVVTTNTRSLQAHYAIGFKKLSTYKTNESYWDLMYLKQ